MYSTTDFKRGLKIEIDGTPYEIVEFQHFKPGKGGAMVRTKLRNILSVTCNTFIQKGKTLFSWTWLPMNSFTLKPASAAAKNAICRRHSKLPFFFTTANLLTLKSPCLLFSKLWKPKKLQKVILSTISPSLQNLKPALLFRFLLSSKSGTR